MIGVFGLQTINCTAMRGGILSIKGSFVLAMAALTILGACTQKSETADPEKVIAAIGKTEEAQAAALGRKDIDEAVAIFADDAQNHLLQQSPWASRRKLFPTQPAGNLTAARVT